MGALGLWLFGGLRVLGFGVYIYIYIYVFLVFGPTLNPETLNSRLGR